MKSFKESQQNGRNQWDLLSNPKASQQNLNKIVNSSKRLRKICAIVGGIPKNPNRILKNKIQQKQKESEKILKNPKRTRKNSEKSNAIQRNPSEILKKIQHDPNEILNN